MAGVTHLPFRLLASSQGATATVTELISIKSLHYSGLDKKNTNFKLDHLISTSADEPTVGLQVFGDSVSDAELLVSHFRSHAFEFDFLDLNVGCPVPKVCDPGAGSRLLEEEKLPILRGIIRTITTGLPDIPFSIKIRAGYKRTSNFGSVSELLNEFELLMVTLHPRTAADNYSVPANHEITKELVVLCHHPVIANGDMRSLEDSDRIRNQTGAAGTMIGRTARAYPWIFNKSHQESVPTEIWISGLRKYIGNCERLGYPVVSFIREVYAGMIKGFNHSSAFRVQATQLGTLKAFWDHIKSLETFFQEKNIEKVYRSLQKHSLNINKSNSVVHDLPAVYSM